MTECCWCYSKIETKIYLSNILTNVFDNVIIDIEPVSNYKYNEKGEKWVQISGGGKQDKTHNAVTNSL